MPARITQRRDPPDLSTIADVERTRGVPFPAPYAELLNAHEGSTVEANTLALPGGRASQVHVIVPAGMLALRIRGLEQRLGPGFLPVALAAGGDVVVRSDDGSVHFYDFRSVGGAPHLVRVAPSIQEFLEALTPSAPAAVAPLAGDAPPPGEGAQGRAEAMGCWW